jgi:predicted RNA binding protein YcfA (HicA-like mRNA interferase family)
MSKFKKLVQSIRDNPRNVQFDDLNKILLKCGFTVRNHSSHYTYSHPDLSEIITIKKENPVKIVYVNKALDAIDLID